jgi:pyruvate dehydrogenase E1 component beta subunit
MARLNIVEAINHALHQEMERDERVVVLGEDVGRNGGVFRVTVGLLEKFGENRVMDTPLAESGIVGTAIGMAVYGLRPVAELQFMGFLYPAFDQLISHASRIRTRSRGRFHCPLVVRMPYGGGIKAPEHHSESTETILIHTPGLKVVVPSTPSDAKGLLISAIRDPDPVIFLEPKKIYRAIKEEVPEEEYIIPLGQAKVIREGKDLSLFSWGAMIPLCLKVANLSQKEGIEVEVIDLRTLYPFDIDTIINSVKKTGRAIVVHEAVQTCGFGAEIIAQINEKALLHLQAPVERVAGFDTVFPLYRAEGYYLPNEHQISKAIKKVMTF